MFSRLNAHTTVAAAALTCALAAPAQSAIVKTPLYIQLGETLTTVETQLKYAGKSRYKGVIELEKGSYPIWLADKQLNCPTKFGPADIADTRLRLNRPQAMTNCAESAFNFKVLMSGRYEFVLDNSDPAAPALTVKRLKSEGKKKRTPPPVACHDWDGAPLTVDVSSVFSDGEQVRDAYSGQLATVQGGNITLAPAAESGGLLLLEAADAEALPFNWDNATVYFIMTDRFNNGDTSNDSVLGRHQDGKDEIGTFHGGDIKGITAKLDYISELGADVIWMTPLVEQIHGYVSGGKKGDFPFYGYHGYWAKDFTRLDPNFGTEEDLRELMREAHARGIRVIFDVVINHVGYANLADMQQLGLDAFKPGVDLPENWGDWKPAPGQSWHAWGELVDWDSPQWAEKWWGVDWIRTGLPGYDKPDNSNLKMALAGLPDFKTETTNAVDLPPILAAKPDTLAVPRNNTTVVDYLVEWQTRWVREFGIDGFRADTVKHVELDSWLKLKNSASEALAEWKAENPEQALDDLPFWMVGEVWGRDVYRDFHFDHGFDSLVNFEYQTDFSRRAAQCMSQAEKAFAGYSKAINSDPGFNAMSYISSHDTKLFYGDFQDIQLQRDAAAPFLLLPGQVQIYYGDETARPVGPFGDDIHQGTRSDMNWQVLADGNKPEAERQKLHAHWQKIANFRKRHPAVGAGQHQMLSQAPYVFSRTLDSEQHQDKVMVVYAGQRK